MVIRDLANGETAFLQEMLYTALAWRPGRIMLILLTAASLWRILPRSIMQRANAACWWRAAPVRCRRCRRREACRRSS